MGLTRPRAYQIYDIDYKQAVRVISKNSVTLSGGAPSQVDGVNLSLNDRVLVAAQSNSAQNGLYYVTTVGSGSNGTWQRSIDGNETGEILAGMIVMVTEGTGYADTQWKLITNNPITIGVTGLTFEQTSAYSFGSIAVAGQNSIVADTVGDVLTVIAGNNIALTTDSVSDALTISVTGISLNSISNGTSNVNVVSSGGNVTVGIAGTSNVAVFSATGANITGTFNATGNANVGNIGAVNAVFTNISGTLTTAAQTNITSVGTLGSLAVTGNISGGNLLTNGNIVDTGAISIVTAASGNVNLAPNGTNTLVVTTTGANITGTFNATGNANVSNLGAATVVATTLTGTLSTASQPNITSVGTLGSLTVTANVAGGNLTTVGQVVATGNITGGNLSIVNDVTISGNLSVTGNATLSGNILGDRIQNGSTSIDIQTPSGNANISISGTSNVAVFSATGANITGALGVTGNITGGNILGNGAGLSGINTFGTIAVSGQSNVVADSISDILTLSAGSGIAITTDAGNDVVTISSIANESIFAIGGSMGTILEVTTVSEDLGLITDIVIDSYDLGTITTGGIVAPSLLLLPSYTVSGLPTADPAGQMVYVSNESGGSVPAFSDGTNWRRVTDRTIVS